MRFKPDPLPDNVGFSEDADLFGYKQFGERLTRVVSGLDQPTTLVLDGPWGSGKSTFLRQWLAELRAAQHPVISFDAFACDFFEDAFIPLSASILKLTEEKVPKKNRVMAAAKKSAGKVIKTVAPIAAKAGVRIISLGVVDYSDVKEGAESAFDALSNAFGDAAEDTARDAINRAVESQSVLEKFHKDIEALVGLYQQKREEEGLPKCPVVFVIDELDRCKPTFALNLVERIKHLFEIEGVIFLLVTNLKQLEAAVCGAYGERTDAATYLEKFYDLRLNLPLVQGKDQITAYVSYLQSKLNITTGDRNVDSAINNMLIGFSRMENLQLRTIERIHAHLLLNVRSLDDNELKLGPMIAGLCIMRHLQPALFDKALVGRLFWKEVSEFFQFGSWAENLSSTWFAQWWQYLTDRDLDQDADWVERLKHSTWQYHIRDPQDLLAWGAKHVVEFDIK
ncbi:P-loop NTPase fold protein [Thalassospira lucentensis]|uniref:KAP family P-loop NTPase fold protein n=1 Tax=Thalassospira lucentensis TaxID=168935 RepID=UPI00399D6DE0